MHRIALRLALLALALAAASARADDIDQKAIDRADAFLKAAKRGQFIAGFCHFGQKYLSHRYAKTLRVKDSTGKLLPGRFALVYDLKASDGLDTQLAFLCDTRGNVEKVEVLASNGVVQKPFAMANLSIKLLGEALYESIKDNVTDGDRRVFRKLVDDADAAGLMVFCLRVQQTTE
jgi:hypothetical protein